MKVKSALFSPTSQRFLASLFRGREDAYSWGIISLACLPEKWLLALEKIFVFVSFHQFLWKSGLWHARQGRFSNSLRRNVYFNQLPIVADCPFMPFFLCVSIRLAGIKNGQLYSSFLCSNPPSVAIPARY
jgi:hypothetical protein